MLARKAEQEVARGDTAAIDSAAIIRRYLVTRKQPDIAAFKTPGLRNVLVTGPYFHDGSMPTLWDVMDHYNKGDGIRDPFLDQDILSLALSESEIDDVVAMLASLTSAPYAALGASELAKQRQLSRVSRPQRDSARAYGLKVPKNETAATRVARP